MASYLEMARKVMARQRQGAASVADPLPVVLVNELTAEGAAIQWVEIGPIREVDTALRQAMAYWDCQVDEQTPVSQPPPEAIGIGDLEPCVQCHSLELWQDGKGNWHCQRCEPPSNKGAALRDLADQLYWRYSPYPIGIVKDVSSEVRMGR